MSAFLSRNPNSPARELLRQRWLQGEWTLLTSAVLSTEVAEKLIAREVEAAEVREFLRLLIARAEWVDVPPDAVPDVLACAVQGRAHFLVTHDRHFDPLGGAYQGVQIVPTLPFLWAVRGDAPPTNPFP